eukprot:scaffold11075_cov132-Isochrysis_galbana.AAC.13
MDACEARAVAQMEVGHRVARPAASKEQVVGQKSNEEATQLGGWGSRSRGQRGLARTRPLARIRICRGASDSAWSVRRLRRKHAGQSVAIRAINRPRRITSLSLPKARRPRRLLAKIPSAAQPLTEAGHRGERDKAVQRWDVASQPFDDASEQLPAGGLRWGGKVRAGPSRRHHGQEHARASTSAHPGHCYGQDCSHRIGLCDPRRLHGRLHGYAGRVGDRIRRLRVPRAAVQRLLQVDPVWHHINQPSRQVLAQRCLHENERFQRHLWVHQREDAPADAQPGAQVLPPSHRVDPLVSQEFVEQRGRRDLPLDAAELQVARIKGRGEDAEQATVETCEGGRVAVTRQRRALSQWTCTGTVRGGGRGRAVGRGGSAALVCLGEGHEHIGPQ